MIQSSVTNTDRSGVSAATQAAAATWSGPIRKLRENAWWTDARTGDAMLSTRTTTTAAVGHRASSQPARTATAIHIAWKYLFMSNDTKLS